MRDDELLAAMWRAFQAAEHVGHPDGPMAAILAVMRAHDRDGERWRERAEQLACMNDGETAERYWAKVDALVERNRGSMPERAAINADAYVETLYIGCVQGGAPRRMR